jgi:maltose O-acetyltransferase
MKFGRHLVRENVKSGPVVIEDDVWIGLNAIILKGVKIGRGAVVGAGSVITKNVDPFTVVAGNPQKVVGKSLP